MMLDKYSSVSFDDRGRRSRSTLELFALLGPALLLILVLFGGGLLLALWQALGHLAQSDTTAIDFKHFHNVFHDPDFGTSLALTFYISITSTCIAACISVLLALALMRWADQSRILSFALQIPLAAPHLVIAVSILLLLSPSGFLSRLCSFLGIISSSSSFPLLVNDQLSISILTVYVWKEVPFITFMLLSVLKNMGSELIEVGATLGSSASQRFRYIVLPFISPSLGAACLIVFAFTFGSFEVPYLLGRTYPVLLPVQAYKKFSDVDLTARPEGIATGLIIAGIVIASILLSQLIINLGRKRSPLS